MVIFKDPVRIAQYTLSVSVIKTNHLMLYREIIAVCSEIHTKSINTVCCQSVLNPVVSIVTTGPGSVNEKFRCVDRGTRAEI
jgi:hypothetical protein